MPLRAYLTLLLLIVTLQPSFAMADTGSLLVRLIDQTTSRPVADATVQLDSRDKQRHLSRSNAAGNARVESLPSGLYTLTVSKLGYQSVKVPSVRFIDDKTTSLTLSLKATEAPIEEVLVIGNTLGANRLASVGASQLDREALRSAAGSGSDVLRALDGLPGLFSDGEFSSYTVRGNGPRDNLILVDGVPFERVVHFSDSFGELDDVEGGGRYSVFAPNVVGNAEFQPGGWNSAYGGKAGSLLKLDVAEGNPETPSYTARLDFAGLEVGYDGPSGLHDDTTLLLSARHLNFGRLFEAIGIEDIGEPSLTDVIVKTRTDLGGGDALKFLLIYAPEAYEREVKHALASDEDSPGRYEDLELVESEADNTLLTASWSRLVGSNAEMTNQVYYRHYGEDSLSGEAYPEGTGATEANTPIRFPIVTASRDETELGWRLDYADDNALGRLSSGLRLSQTDVDFARALDGDWIRYQYESTDFRPNPDQKYIVLTPSAVNSELSESTWQGALYADQEFAIGSIDFRAGFRVDHFNITDDSGVSPRFAATWPAADKLVLNLTAGRYLQAPRLEDIASDSRNQLGFETIDQLSFGVKYQLRPRLEVFIEPYYQVLNDLVVLSDGVNQTFANTGEGTSYGIDTAITRYFDHGWSASATYSYNNTQVQDTPTGEKYDADYSRPHAASFGGVWEISEHWKISGRFKWASGRPYGDAIIHENVLGDAMPLRYSKEIISNNTERFDSYSSLNIRLDYRQNFGRTQLIAFVDVINLLGADNPSSEEFNERTGENAIEDGESIPLIGLRFEW